MTDIKPKTSATTVEHRIGGVSALSGVPVSTLRVWEIRYSAFHPHLTEGRQRLYSDDDVLRATLLKRLSDQGHTISNIASLDANRLNALLQQQNEAQWHTAKKTAEPRSLTVAVIGLALGARLATEKFKKILTGAAVQVTEIYPDLDAALAGTPNLPAQFLLVRVNSLHAMVQVDLHRLIERCKVPQVILLYRFGQERVVESLKRAGMVVRREPVTDYELADLFRSSLLIDAPQAIAQPGMSATIPARKYDDATLARVAGISSNLLCECPRHVAEIITQLVSFEQYSQECLNKTSEDAQLHAYLHSVSGSARALFEHALEMVAEHEGFKLGA